jgi:hypothetical protein
MKPLLLLDVDGVLNALNERQRNSPHTIRFKAGAHGSEYDIVIPDYMPKILERIVPYAEIMWLTTWRCEANVIGAVLGLPELPCIDDGGTGRYVEWKWGTARPVVEEAMSQGRVVLWVEDFDANGNMREATWAGVRCIDTAQTGYVLTNADGWRLGDLCRQLVEG